MMNCDKLDLKVILSFANSYRNLYQEGTISKEQLNNVLYLIDHYQDYRPEEFQQNLKNIFPDSTDNL
ncbi:MULTISPECIES: hypothetical protein [unclassified Halanaerobium]|uniref:hypothetical protein n=1 Tax=unclassified Halanaerobium TaxID=2641197 RepID=UPI000DF49AEA|nr:MULTISPECIES: hypothetical protein [unclassified Halanaerobium]RCW44124.1 hypothetical protein DFR78_12125 [Halanaerobium sp. MA284_MarDTE_T2]RCW86982.1 hypothetical protein DER71_10690 [Halanaerobium sp. DL-01]